MKTDPRQLFCDEEEHEIVKLHDVGGYSMSKIGRAYNTSHGTITKILRRNGSAPRTSDWKNRRFTDSQELEMKRLYEIERLSSRKIANMFGCSQRMVFIAIRRQDGTVRSPRDGMLLLRPNIVDSSYPYPRITVSRLPLRAREIATAMGQTRVQVHRLVMAMHLRRPLRSDEIIHHKDGNKSNYHLSNLELLAVNTHHSGHGPYYQHWQEALSEIKRMRDRLSKYDRHS